MKKIMYGIVAILATSMHAQNNSSSQSGHSSQTTNSNQSGAAGNVAGNQAQNASLFNQPRTSSNTNSISIYEQNHITPTVNTGGNKTQLYAYMSVPGDPLNARIYTLKNGLTVYLSQNKNEPRLQTYIAVKAGSKFDPKETTGLAHYLEHMMFKGTDKIGTTNWTREQLALQNIAQLYEKHRTEKDPEKKKDILKQIDAASVEAAKFAVPNEYDKMISSLGAKGTNAYTSVEQTVYVNDIPTNELEKWLVLESERFKMCVLRLFETELEAVYEEYNMGLDRDGTKMNKVFNKAMFPTHPYGTQTTIGEGEHLKNPSMFNILNYFNLYYVPNNMAICISGDLNYDQTIALIDKYFGVYNSRPVPEFKFTPEKPLSQIERRDVYGMEAETMEIGYRLPGANSRDAVLANVVEGILSNGQAGLIDLNLVQNQKILKGGADATFMKDYSTFSLYADPREGQSLEDCEKLLIEQIDKVKKGEFDDWLVSAVVNDYKLSQIKSYETNSGRANAFVYAFTKGIDWKSYAAQVSEMEKFTKKDVMDFAKTYFTNYVVVYKRKGEDTSIKKVEKPAITSIEANRDAQSDFLKKYMTLTSDRFAPDFLNYQTQIKTQPFANDVTFSSIKNETNQLFELYYIFDMGSDNDNYLSLAVNYLPFLGTDKLTAAQLQEEFFRYGLRFNVSTSRDRTYISLTGLETNLEKGIELFEDVLNNVQADKKAYDEYVKGILKERADNKLSKNIIFGQALSNYAKYGAVSPFTDIISENNLKTTDPTLLTSKIKSLSIYKHRIFYYGQRDPKDVITMLQTYHRLPGKQNDYPTAKKFPELPTDKNVVYFVNYNMVQVQVAWMSKDINFNKNMMAPSRVFNEYFGSGLSSIVFQEIRETKALAYSAYSNYTVPANKDEAHYVRAFVATQADKMQQAIEAMDSIMTVMPRADEQLNNSIESVEKQIESERITKSAIFWSYENAKRKGLNYDARKDIYSQIQGMTMEDMQKFFDQHIADRKYVILVMGDKNKVDINYLKSLGEFHELTLNDIFGY